MLKEVTPVYKNIDAQAMSGTNTITSAVTNVVYKDSVAIQLNWTGDPVGTFTVQGCLDYVPSNPQGGGTPNSGTWDDIPLTGIPAAAGVADTIIINMQQVAWPYIRVIYTNISGSGTLNGYISGKSLG